MKIWIETRVEALPVLKIEASTIEESSELSGLQMQLVKALDEASMYGLAGDESNVIEPLDDKSVTRLSIPVVLGTGIKVVKYDDSVPDSRSAMLIVARRKPRTGFRT